MATDQVFDDNVLSLCLARISEAAALASADLIGRGDEDAADDAAIAAMQRALNNMDIRGRVVIGEGEEGEAPQLFVGEAVGTGDGPEVDVALVPLEGRTLAAKNMPNALAVVAMAPLGSMLRVPDIYMDKLAVGPGIAQGVVTLDMTPQERIEAFAAARNCAPEALTICVLDRPRHEDLIANIRATNARARLISDGDVAGAIHAAESTKTGIDMYMGSGGAPEGVLAAAALKCLGGQMEGRLMIRSKDDATLARLAGIETPDKIFSRDDMVTSDVIFAATGVTDGALLRGVRRRDGQIRAETLLMRSATGSHRRIRYRRRAS
jgi:fructose-1,6-bisphosphatase II / sedoheptulose-1,7-bisphosphatase